MEKVVVKPGGLFRRTVTESRPATRVVSKIRQIRVPDGIRHDLYKSSGESITQIEFRLIPAGKFVMDEKCQVTISRDFCLGKYPVTQAQWQAVMGGNPSHFKGAERPVENVSWEDCQAFIEKLNGRVGNKTYRLPTEAEWEYACRAGFTTTYCYGDDPARLGEYAWYNENSGEETHPVGQKKPNAWGLHDMHGNVLEWCADWCGDLSAGAIADPFGPPAGSIRVNRGGSLSGGARLATSACRNGYEPGHRFNFLGFRLVAPPGP